MAVAPARFGSMTLTNQGSFETTPCPWKLLEIGGQKAEFAGQLDEASVDCVQAPS
jgi:hypothetical protein